jgi:hypothetical protein
MNDQAAFAHALLDPARPAPADLLVWNGSDPAARLAVYRNNVVMSLLGVLADTFPVTRELVGDAFFSAMGREFVRAQPPAGPVMAEYGAGFPAFIRHCAPAKALPYLADVALLEWLRLVALHAADAVSLSAAGIAPRLAEAADLTGWRLRLHPSFAVLRADHAAVSIWAAHQGVGDLAAIDLSASESAWILRRELEVDVIPVAAAAGAFACALLAGQPLGAALAGVAAQGLTLDLPATLAGLIRHGALVAIEPTQTADD